METELPPPEAVLLSDDQNDSRMAKLVLAKRMVRYRELANPQDPYLKSYTCPTLLVCGAAYEGLSAIKRAVGTDPNLW
jgi:hypothetical protein